MLIALRRHMVPSLSCLGCWRQRGRHLPQGSCRLQDGHIDRDSHSRWSCQNQNVFEARKTLLDHFNRDIKRGSYSSENVLVSPVATLLVKCLVELQSHQAMMKTNVMQTGSPAA